ncbi:MAG: response regulator [Clostridiales bacterium]|jgi:two-component SAPR family response regulator|nr:response regulator [Clostridiales bacterium]
MKIIVVDDELAALSNFFTHVVDDPELEYKMFRDEPAAALEYAERIQPDAAFLDINMPSINGVALAEKLIGINPRIGIVFISGYAQNEEEIAARLGSNLKGFCYKPYDSQELYRFLTALCIESGIKARIRAFGLFDIQLRGKSLNFSCAKSKELLALLVDKRGARVPMDIAIACLWPDRPTEQSKRLYRDAVIRLRITLKEYGLSGLVSFFRGELAVNPDLADCDYWLALDSNVFSGFFGEYMIQYADWSAETQNYLEAYR